MNDPQCGDLCASCGERMGGYLCLEYSMRCQGRCMDDTYETKDGRFMHWACGMAKEAVPA